MMDLNRMYVSFVINRTRKKKLVAQGVFIQCNEVSHRRVTFSNISCIDRKE